MVAPKSKTSKQRRNLRRSSVWKLRAPALAACPKCGEYKLPHRACLACGTYNGREVIVLKDKKKKAK
ncbi:MAG: 50S ribosomal protein L32 [Oscillospiraceae bacterium]|jgi:large subunit ribosomal protein L32|nr:50S ribosomal protein L32 [Oscillospiraceae bacterium]